MAIFVLQLLRVSISDGLLVREYGRDGVKWVEAQ